MLPLTCLGALRLFSHQNAMPENKKGSYPAQHFAIPAAVISLLCAPRLQAYPAAVISVRTDAPLCQKGACFHISGSILRESSFGSCPVSGEWKWNSPASGNAHSGNGSDSF